MVRFKFLTGDVNFTTYGGKWISNAQSNSEFTYYFVIELMNWKEAVGEREAPAETYHISLDVVSPEQAGEENMRSALQDYPDIKITPEIQVEALHQYAGGVPVFSANGNNWKDLMKQAKKEAQVKEMFFGFAMDRVVNRIGETGWERLKLTDPRVVLDRVIAEHEAAV